MKKQVRNGVINDIALRNISNDRNIDPVEEFLEYHAEMKPSRRVARKQRDNRREFYRDKKYE